MFFGLFLAYQRWADRFAEFTGKLAAWIVIPTVTVGFVNVVLRYIGQATSTRLTTNTIIELQWYMYSGIFLLGFPYILKHQINVRVDFWFAHQGPKRKAWIDFAGHWIGLIPFALIGIFVAFPQGIKSWTRWEQSPDADGLPRGPIKMLLAISFLLLLIQAVAEQIKLYAVITDRAHLVALEGAHEQPVKVE